MPADLEELRVLCKGRLFTEESEMVPFLTALARKKDWSWDCGRPAG